MAEKSKILIIGSTGYIGKYIVEASAKAGHPTFALVRESRGYDPDRDQLIHNFNNLGVTLLNGNLFDHKSLVDAMKQVDVVISTVGHKLLIEQDKIIAAIKDAGNVKRFLPSEFGIDHKDLEQTLEPAKSAFEIKVKIRRAIEAEGIPYTYVFCKLFAGYYLPTLAQLGGTAIPRDKVVILGDGKTTAIFNTEVDIATFTIRAVDDPRTLNKGLYLNLSKNIYSFNDLVTLWEKKIGKRLEKCYVPEDQFLKDLQESPIHIKIELSINHMLFVRGDPSNSKIDPSFGVEASKLYPDVKYTTVEDYLDQYV